MRLTELKFDDCNDDYTYIFLPCGSIWLSHGYVSHIWKLYWMATHVCTQLNPPPREPCSELSTSLLLNSTLHGHKDGQISLMKCVLNIIDISYKHIHTQTGRYGRCQLCLLCIWILLNILVPFVDISSKTKGELVHLRKTREWEHIIYILTLFSHVYLKVYGRLDCLCDRDYSDFHVCYPLTTLWSQTFQGTILFQ